jgi:hypothetical protein
LREKKEFALTNNKKDLKKQWVHNEKGNFFTEAEADKNNLLFVEIESKTNTLL